jgi:hypothetical protein
MHKGRVRFEKFRTVGSLLDNTYVRRRRVFTKQNPEETGATLKHDTEITQIPCITDRHLEIVTIHSEEDA